MSNTPSDALAKLRHLYANMMQGSVRDTASAKRIAEGLLAPAIELLERSAAPQQLVEPLTDAQIAEMMRDTWGCASIAPRHALEFARAIERAHGIAQKGGD